MRVGGTRAPLALALIAIVSGVLAAWMVQKELESAMGRSGPPATVLVAAREIEAGTRVSADYAMDAVTVVEVPESFVPPDAFRDVSEVAALRALTDIPQGGYLTKGAFSNDSAADGFRLRGGERAISIDAMPTPDGAEPRPGSVVDLVASGNGGAQDSRLLISGAEVLAVAESSPSSSDSGDPDEPPTGPQSRLTIRVAASQVPMIVRADVFARELRAVVR